MSIDKTNIHNNIQACVDGVSSSTQTSDLVVLSNAIDDSTIDRKNYVETGDGLPDLYFGDTPEGTIYHVKELGVPLVASDHCWLGLDGRLYRNDLPEFQLYSAGINSSGSYGDNTPLQCTTSPVREITSSIDWKEINGSNEGNSSSLALKYDGTIWGWGFNGSGAVGDNSIINRSSPVQEVSSSTEWISISKNRSSSAIKKDGSLWSWGSGNLGSLGVNNVVSYSSPVQEVTSSTDWCHVSVSGCYINRSDSGTSSTLHRHTSAIKTDGSLWGWGGNVFGQVGDGTTICRSSPVQEMTSSNDWLTSSSGAIMVAAIKTNGNIWTWGGNNCFRLGRTTLASAVCPSCANTGDYCQVAPGGTSVLAVKNDGSLWGWGDNTSGQLGTGTAFCYSITPVQEVTSSTDWVEAYSFFDGMIARKSNGTVWTAGCGTNQVVSRTNQFACCYTSPVAPTHLNAGGPYGCAISNGATAHLIKIVG